MRRILNITLCFCWSSCFFADVDFTNHWNVLNVFTSSLPHLSSRWQIRLLCKFKPPVIAFPANFDVFHHINMTVRAHKSTLKSLIKQGWLEWGVFFDPGEQMWFSGVFIVTWWSFTDHLVLFRWCSADAFKVTVKEWRWRAETRRRSQVTDVISCFYQFFQHFWDLQILRADSSHFKSSIPVKVRVFCVFRWGNVKRFMIRNLTESLPAAGLFWD